LCTLFLLSGEATTLLCVYYVAVVQKTI